MLLHLKLLLLHGRLLLLRLLLLQLGPALQGCCHLQDHLLPLCIILPNRWRCCYTMRLLHRAAAYAVAVAQPRARCCLS
jgi:hypothetical protein